MEEIKQGKQQMKDKKRSRVFIRDYMVLIALGLGAFYWIFDAFFSMFLAKSGLNPFQLLVTSEPGAGWTRLIVLCLFVIFGSHAQFTIKERNEAARRSEREAATRERFQRLLSPDLAEMVVSGELRVEKGGEKREATVLFADFRDYTRISENKDAAEMLKIINEYFEVIVNTVFRHRGTVDKFIGDEVMVLWGAPVTHADDPIRAVRSALEIQSEIAEFNRLRATEGLLQIRLGISINTGNLVAGYIGSTRTMSYSVIGDVVNVAHGICPAAKAGQIIISENTHSHVKDIFEAAEIAPVHVKGKDDPILAYEVLGEKHPSTPA